MLGGVERLVAAVAHAVAALRHLVCLEARLILFVAIGGERLEQAARLDYLCRHDEARRAVLNVFPQEQVHRVVARRDDTVHGMYDAVDAKDVAVVLVDDAVAHEDAVGQVGILHDELAVVHVSQGNLHAVGGGGGNGQVAYLVFAVVVAAVDDAVEHNDLCDGVALVLTGEGIPAGFGDEAGVAERVEESLDGIVGGCEDGVVAAS